MRKMRRRKKKSRSKNKMNKKKEGINIKGSVRTKRN